MTVSYNFDANSTTWFSLAKILFRWKGSVWKAVFSEALTFVIFFITINVVIRHQFNDIQMRNFKELRNAVRENLSRIPLAFLLGFFVSVVFNRWVAIFNHIGFIDNLALSISVIIRGPEPETRLLKRNIIRYAVLSQTLVFRDISIPVRKRFPQIESIVQSGIMTQKEFEIFERKEMQDNKYWVPIQWAMMLVLKARQEDKICNDVIMFNIMEKIKQFRTDLQYLCCYDWVPVPMAYPQIVFLAVRFYFFCQLIARQSLPIDELDIFVPIMTFMELLLLVGWLKVAEALLNPFGEDDDDFECNYVIDRNLSTGFEIVELYEQPPCTELDRFWTMAIPKPLDILGGGIPGSAASMPAPKKKRHRPYHGSVADLNLDSRPQTSFHSPTGVHDPLSTNSKTAESVRRRLSRKIFPLQKTWREMLLPTRNKGDIQSGQPESQLQTSDAGFSELNPERLIQQNHNCRPST
uniref:Bestrophin homolog n=1 Tax=Ditylenchus dipsaci TaxID=166011 RepID=A0A915E4E8_9BILA